ncbi:hypothetical protein PybrP1_011336 [[Pythium] brassicae (nom. inval.)]|nr:hypothetical protein PybrP1_011336 [[Pythium] brassicae (nom. inval.)]
MQIQALTRKLGQQRKLNAELQQQLHVFLKNEAVAHLENQNKEKQLRIDELLHENRLVVHQQRLLAKQVEELQADKINSPMKKHALQEELRVCKESLRRRKEQQKGADEKMLKVHQHSVDLAAKNKTLLERSIVASQEDEITRLQQRVALMKKAQRSDKVKQDRRLQASQAETEQARQQLDRFHQQLFAKEKTIRGLFLQMKGLKRAVQDLTNTQQTNLYMQQMVLGREGRFVTQHSPRRQNQHPHRASQQQLRQHSPSHLHSSSTQALPLAPPHRREPPNRVYRTLQQLGYVPSFASQSLCKPVGSSVDGEEEGEKEEEEEELPPNCVQGKLLPGPPPSSAARRALESGGRTPRSDVVGVQDVISRCESDDEDCGRSSEEEDDGADEREGGDASASEADDDVAFD